MAVSLHLALSFALLFVAAGNALQLPTVIDSNMVLQRSPYNARVWGFGTAGEKVTVTVVGETPVTNTTTSDGMWEVNLPPHSEGSGFTLKISSSTGQTITLTNIAFGDVFLCSGQSNMQFSVNDAFNASAEIADSINYPNLRLFTVALIQSLTPLDNCSSASNYTWGVSSPAAFQPVGGAAFSWFSATCYFFGRDVYRALGGKVPIGLIASDWGGQPVEAFSSPDALADNTCGGTVKPSEARTHKPQQFTVAVPPTSLWFGMIYPLIKMRFAGAVWYQGEANAGDPHSYACRFPAMISDWRSKMQLSLPFFFVQLAAYSSDYSLIRQAQMAALQLENVGYAIAIDLGDPTSPEGNIHPRRKQEVGRRLSLSALHLMYNQNVSYLGPQLQSYSLELDDESGTTTATMVFTEAEVSLICHWRVSLLAFKPVYLFQWGFFRQGIVNVHLHSFAPDPPCPSTQRKNHVFVDNYRRCMHLAPLLVTRAVHNLHSKLVTAAHGCEPTLIL
eukprot:m.27831 g.27831  ORF g.27831 m.27831 type:complete len:504 (+) comp10338_c0_seq2:59-1570(+)